jgi:hypothetical protein
MRSLRLPLLLLPPGNPVIATSAVNGVGLVEVR